MSVAPRTLAIAAAVVGVILWVVAILVDAPLVGVVIPVLMVMGGGLGMAATSTSGRDRPGRREPPR